MSAKVGPMNQQRLGEQIWARMGKVNTELFTLTYGAIVTQILKDLDDVEQANIQLEKMGHNIGVRLVDEFLAKSGVNSCGSFRDTAETIAKVAFKMFLGVTVEVASFNAEGTAFSLLLYDNPLVEFVELPAKFSDLIYCNILCGVIKGALECVLLHVDVKVVRDVLKGEDVTELRVELKGVLDTVMADEYKEN